MPIENPVPFNYPALWSKLKGLYSQYGPSPTEMNAIMAYPGNPLDEIGAIAKGVGELAPMAGMVITPKTINLFRKLFTNNLMDMIKSRSDFDLVPNMALAFLKTRYPTTYSRVKRVEPKVFSEFNSAEFVPELKRINFNPAEIDNNVEAYIKTLGHEFGHAANIARRPENLKYGQAVGAILDILLKDKATTMDKLHKYREFYENTPGEVFANKVGQGAVLQYNKLRNYK